MTQSSRTYIIGVGLVRFLKPQSKNDYVEMAHEAGIKALLDAHITYDNVQRGIGSYCYGDSTCGQRVFYTFGMTGIPIYNVNNNCASGSTAMVMAREFVQSDLADCVLAVGFEKMNAGSLGSNFTDRTNPLGTAMKVLKDNWPSDTRAAFAPQMFGNAAQEYMRKHGATPQDFAEVARANHEHSQFNPYSQFQTKYTLEEVEKSAPIFSPLTKLQCCPTSDGAAAAVVVSEAFLSARPELRAQAVEIIGQSMTTDKPLAYSGSAMNLVGYEMVKATAADAMSQAQMLISDIKVAEVHDCFSANEILAIDAIGFSAPGKAHEYVRQGQHTVGSSKTVINPSGGLISKGHPLGASGIAQCAELVWQLRGWANNRLVPVPSSCAALQQNAGLGGACVVTILRRADGQNNQPVTSDKVSYITGLGYNPAVESRGISIEDEEKVMSKLVSPQITNRMNTVSSHSVANL